MRQVADIWIYPVECDFCNNREDLQHVEFPEDSMRHHYACKKCVENKRYLDD